jgi:hypothetical protein
MNETHILIRLLLNWKFGSALAKLRNFGVEPPSLGTPLCCCTSRLGMFATDKITLSQLSLLQLTVTSKPTAQQAH